MSSSCSPTALLKQRKEDERLRRRRWKRKSNTHQVRVLPEASHVKAFPSKQALQDDPSKNFPTGQTQILRALSSRPAALHERSNPEGEKDRGANMSDYFWENKAKCNAYQDVDTPDPSHVEALGSRHNTTATQSLRLLSWKPGSLWDEENQNKAS